MHKRLAILVLLVVNASGALAGTKYLAKAKDLPYASGQNARFAAKQHVKFDDATGFVTAGKLATAQLLPVRSGQMVMFASAVTRFADGLVSYGTPTAHTPFYYAPDLIVMLAPAPVSLSSTFATAGTLSLAQNLYYAPGKVANFAQSSKVTFVDGFVTTGILSNPGAFNYRADRVVQLAPGAVSFSGIFVSSGKLFAPQNVTYGTMDAYLKRGSTVFFDANGFLEKGITGGAQYLYMGSGRYRLVKANAVVNFAEGIYTP